MTKAAGYRKHKSSRVWHFCRNCSNWPNGIYDSHPGGRRPRSGKLCDECLGKAERNNCT